MVKYFLVVLENIFTNTFKGSMRGIHYPKAPMIGYFFQCQSNDSNTNRRNTSINSDCSYKSDASAWLTYLLS